MLRWVFIVIISGSYSVAADVCKDAIDHNITVCEEALIDPAFQRAHATSPRSNALIYDLSQSCVNDIADCFDKCNDSRFRDGNKFEQVLKLLRPPLGESLVTSETRRCRENLNKYAKGFVKICKKFKVHQTAAADTTDAQQRILSDHCSKFSTYLEPLGNESGKIKKASKSSKSHKTDKVPQGASRGSFGAASVNGDISGRLHVGSPLNAAAPQTTNSKYRKASDLQLSASGVRDLRDRSKSQSKQSQQKRGQQPDKRQGFVSNAPANFQPLGASAKVKKRKRVKGASKALKSQSKGLAGQSYENRDTPTPASSGRVDSGVPKNTEKGQAVSAATLQNLKDRLFQRGMDPDAPIDDVERDQIDQNDHIFNATGPIFRKIRRQELVIEN